MVTYNIKAKPEVLLAVQQQLRLMPRHIVK